MEYLLTSLLAAVILVGTCCLGRRIEQKSQMR